MLAVCREVNQFLGVAAFALVMFRFAAHRDWFGRGGRWTRTETHRALLLTVLALYVFASSLASIQAEQAGTAVGPVSVLVTVLDLAVLGLCAWWPPVAEPDGEAPDGPA